MVGDASMAPYELLGRGGAIGMEEITFKPSYERLKFLAAAFPKSVWLNPRPSWEWSYIRTVGLIAQIFPMFDLTLDRLGKAVSYLMRKG